MRFIRGGVVGLLAQRSPGPGQIILSGASMMPVLTISKSPLVPLPINDFGYYGTARLVIRFIGAY